jgi:hypothetical protein
VWPAAQVLEWPVAVQRHRLDALVADQILDQLDLVRLALVPELLDRLIDRQLAALERLVGLDVGAHPLLDPGQVLLTRPLAVRKLEVVVEAVLDRRADRDLRLRPQLEHRRRHHVRGVVSQRLEVVCVVLGHRGFMLSPHLRRQKQVSRRPDRSGSGCRARRPAAAR